MNKKLIAAVAAAPAIAFAPLSVATPVAHADPCYEPSCCYLTYSGQQQQDCLAAVGQSQSYG
jgi:uncharacterized membrane protein